MSDGDESEKNYRRVEKIIEQTIADGCPTREPRDFVFLKSIGDGAYSSVYRAKELSSGAEFAIKVLQKAHINRHEKMNSIIREKNVMNYLTQMCGTHPFVSQLYTSFQDATRLYFVQMLADRGDLSEALSHFGCFDTQTTVFFCSEILAGLDYIHRNNIIHRDIKPENVLIKQDGHIMITDFGSAQAYQDLNLPMEGFEGEFDDVEDFSSSESISPPPTRNQNYSDEFEGGPGAPDDTGRRTTFVGTAQYVSPEMLNDGDVGPHSDHWALGCILYQCLSGQAPFRAVNHYHMMRKVQELDFEYPEGFPQHGADLVNKILKFDLELRISSDEMKDHPFFADVDWDDITNQKVPKLNAYCPATNGEPEFYSNVEPGLDDKALIRLMNISSSSMANGTTKTAEEIQKLFDLLCNPPPLKPAEIIVLPAVQEEKQLAAKQAKPKRTREEILKANRELCFTDEELDVKPGTAAPPPPRTKSEIEQYAKRREEKLEIQRNENPYHLFAGGRLILKQGFLDKKRGLFARKRMFILTEGPHLLYVDHSNMVLKGEIPWSPCMQTEIKNFGTFFIHTPDRVYYLFDEERRALEWCQAIQLMRVKYASEIEQTFEIAMRDGTFHSIYGKKKTRKEMMRAEKAMRRKREKENKKAARLSEQLARQSR